MPDLLRPFQSCVNCVWVVLPVPTVLCRAEKVGQETLLINVENAEGVWGIAVFMDHPTTIEPLRSSQIYYVRDLIYETADTLVAFPHLLRYCLFANARAFVALAGPRIVGFVGGSDSGQGSAIDYLCVDQAYRNLGIATSLIDVFLRASPGTAYCELDLRLSNTKAREFYLRRGFKETQTKLLYYRDEDGLTMRLKLPSVRSAEIRPIHELWTAEAQIAN